MHRPIRKKTKVWNYDVKENYLGEKKEISEKSSGRIGLGRKSIGKESKGIGLVILCITFVVSFGILVQRGTICFSK